MVKPARSARPTAVADQTPRADGTPEGLNYSQLSEWMRCRYRWHLKYRRKIDRRYFVPSMDLGSATHAGLGAACRAYANQRTPTLTPKGLAKIRQALQVGVTSFQQEWIDEHGGRIAEDVQEQLAETVEQAQSIAWRTIEGFELDRWEILSLNGLPLIEQKLSVPLFPGLDWYGTSDFVGKDRTRIGGIWPLDWKIRQGLQQIEHEEVDLQLPTYQHLLHGNGILTAGSIKYQVLAVAPSEPSLNQNGSMSRAKIRTTWEVYKKALLRAGLDPGSYVEDMKPKLRGVEWQRETRLFRNQFTIDTIWNQIIVPQARLWVKAKSQPRHMSFMSCTGCWAREFCIGELRGEAMEFLLETQYVDLTKPAPKVMMRPEDFNFTED